MSTVPALTHRSARWLTLVAALLFTPASNAGETATPAEPSHSELTGFWQLARPPAPRSSAVSAPDRVIPVRGAAGSPVPPGDAVDALIARALKEMSPDPRVAFADTKQALALLRVRPDVDRSIMVHTLICEYQTDRDASAASVELAELRRLLPLSAHPGLAIGPVLCEAEQHYFAGDYSTARRLFEQSIRMPVDAGNSLFEQMMHAAAGNAHAELLGQQGDLATSLSELRWVQPIYEKLGDRWSALKAFNDIASIYERIGDSVQAAHLYGQILDAQRAAGQIEPTAKSEYNLARVYEHTGDWGRARVAYADVLEISRTMHYAAGTAHALRGLGAAAVAAGDDRRALRLLAQADAAQRNEKNTRLEAEINLERGTAFHHLRRFAESVQALSEAVKWFRSGATVNDLARAESELASTYADVASARRYRALCREEVRAQLCSQRGYGRGLRAFGR